jgi:hypothetical protein
MKTTRQSASNYYGLQLTIVDTTPGDLAGGGTTVPVPDSAKVYLRAGSTMVIDGEDCQIDDNGDGTVNLSYRPTVTEVTQASRAECTVQFWAKWPDVGGIAVEQWFEPEPVILMPNLG